MYCQIRRGFCTSVFITTSDAPSLTVHSVQVWDPCRLLTAECRVYHSEETWCMKLVSLSLAYPMGASHTSDEEYLKRYHCVEQIHALRQAGVQCSTARE